MFSLPHLPLSQFQHVCLDNRTILKINYHRSNLLSINNVSDKISTEARIRIDDWSRQNTKPFRKLANYQLIVSLKIRPLAPPLPLVYCTVAKRNPTPNPLLWRTTSKVGGPVIHAPTGCVSCFRLFGARVKNYRLLDTATGVSPRSTEKRSEGMITRCPAFTTLQGSHGSQRRKNSCWKDDIQGRKRSE